MTGNDRDHPRAWGALERRSDSLSEATCRLFQRLVQREAGIRLSDDKRLLAEGRLSPRLRELGHLLLGHAEAVSGALACARSVGPSVFTRATAAPAGRG